MEIWVTLWCRGVVRRLPLDLSFDVAVSAGREVRSPAGGSRPPRPNAVATAGWCSSKVTARSV